MDEQTSLEFQQNTGPVEVLGITFENDDTRREYFRNELRKKLPELKKIEGFPIGKDEDIIALSDPPYYTACPNPFISDFLEEWNTGVNEEYEREPFASDVSIGKNDPIYTAHTYHTKVPYKAIVKYLLHYTKPGDVVLDNFAGTGMTGVAASMAGSKEVVKEIDSDVRQENIGPRKAIINDLSPVASFISYNYNTPFDKEELIHVMKNIISESTEELGWMYDTEVDGQKAKINYVVWTDSFACPNCQHEFAFYNVAFDEKSNSVLKEFNCPKCGVELTKEKAERVFETSFDTLLGRSVSLGKQVPVAVNYILGKQKKLKKFDSFDESLLNKINEMPFLNWIPIEKVPDGMNTRQPLSSHGIDYVHQFYTKRNLLILSDLYDRILSLPDSIRPVAYLTLQSIIYTLTSKLVRYNLGNRGNGILNGTLYISSMTAEANIYKILEGKVRDIAKALVVNSKSVVSGVASATDTGLPHESIDYIFTDPPFGANINYSELNFIWEAWLKVKTQNEEEAIINKVQQKELFDYQRLMEKSFKEYYYALKPNRWITVEFSNSKASVWNSIQEAMQKAGFVIANVAALDKKQGSFKAVTSTTAVKQDLVISAYKPSQHTIKKMLASNNTDGSAWAFVTDHLLKLPVFQGEKGEAQVITERTPRILFDRMVAFHVQSGLLVPISSSDFQQQIAEHFVVRDGMAFLESQVAEYDKKRLVAKDFAQQSLFVSDENSAIEWLRQKLMKKPQTRQDIQPDYMKEIQHIVSYEELPELDNLLEQNFLMYDGEEAVPTQIRTYLTISYHELRGKGVDDIEMKSKGSNRWYVPDPNKAADLAKLREKSLLREFEHYVEIIESSQKKLKTFRTEAIRTGFKKAWEEKKYTTIVSVGDKLPEKVIQEDDKLLMYYDNAVIRTEM